MNTPPILLSEDDFAELLESINDPMEKTRLIKERLAQEQAIENPPQAIIVQEQTPIEYKGKPKGGPRPGAGRPKKVNFVPATLSIRVDQTDLDEWKILLKTRYSESCAAELFKHALNLLLDYHEHVINIGQPSPTRGLQMNHSLKTKGILE